jgi:hypothetical protein
MQKIRSSAAQRRALPDWYQLYFAAVLEADDRKMLTQIGRACRAIENRLIELRCVSPDNPHEVHDLNCALTYLTILLQNVGDENNELTSAINPSGLSASLGN